MNEKTGLQDREIASRRGGAQAGIPSQLRLIEQLGRPRGRELHEAREFRQMTDIADATQIPFQIRASKCLQPKSPLRVVLCGEAQGKATRDDAIPVEALGVNSRRDRGVDRPLLQEVGPERGPRHTALFEAGDGRQRQDSDPPGQDAGQIRTVVQVRRACDQIAPRGTIAIDLLLDAPQKLGNQLNLIDRDRTRLFQERQRVPLRQSTAGQVIESDIPTVPTDRLGQHERGFPHLPRTDNRHDREKLQHLQEPFCVDAVYHVLKLYHTMI